MMTRESSEEAFVFNPFTDGFTNDPYPYYAELRDAAPAHEHPLGFWILSRYEDVSKLQRSGHSVDERYLTRLPRWKSDSRTLGKENRLMRGLAVLDQDPPNHTRLRGLVSKAFTRRAVDALEPRIATLVDRALDRIAEAGRADLVAELAFPLPFTVISEMLGIPVVEHTRIRALTGTLVRALEPLADPGLQAEIRAANHELMGIVRELTDWKRDNPGDDLISALLAAEHDGDVLGGDELVAQVMFLYIAGHESTVNLLAGGILALLRHPGQLRLLREDPGLVANAVEEILRYDTPVHLMRRITIESLPAHGEEIPAGAWVVACLAAANRDPRFWGADADELRLDRPNAHQNVSFGAGIHHCLGAALARLEARVTFTRFARRFPSPAVEEVRWNGRINVRGPAKLLISVR
ncbi:cytochrome P450 [Candidatus Protofrankia datiscae]|uniref:Linalool 8-monooxygenase n=1 Tax=Candidatus Protofrankia datiscae TaxID=2716812 RepID=F8AWW1_9ACTN|nr:cytochrome P450 [Candidatus Protofrankia datiscae]AEH10341.1 Linalool 8-monooxygenase [Candidatus Protofrankia datiscae]